MKVRLVSTRWFWVVLAAGLVAAVRPVPAAGLTTRTATVAGRTRVTLASSALELVFDPARGGRCVRFTLLDRQEQILPASAGAREDDPSGMFLDHWAKYPWPSGLMHLPYQYELIGDGKTRQGLHLWVTVPATGGGRGTPDAQNSLTIPTSPDLIGLVVHKTIWLNAANDLIEVEQEVRNPTGESRGVALYAQNVATMGGKRLSNNWYLPSTRGVLVNLQGANETERNIGPDWVLDPTAGWMAVLHRQTHRGLLFSFDYNTLEKLYTCGMTAEWFLETVPVSPGGSFKTRYVIKPLNGLTDVAYGSPRVVADLQPRQTGAAVTVTQTLAAVSQELTGVTADFTVTGFKSQAALLSKQIALGKVGFTPQTQQFTFTPQALSDGVVIRVRLTSSAGEDDYELYYAGDKDARDRRTNYFATPGGALAGARGNTYYQKPPRKHKQITKPDFATLARPDPGRFRCLVAFGLYTQWLRLDDALANWKSPTGRPVDFDWANCPPNAAEKFPGSYEELFRYDAVVLSDVNAKSLGDIGLEMLCDYVQQGGRLLVTGGPYALGNGEYEETRLLDLLPVKLSGPFDVKWAGKGQSWPLVAAQPEAPLLRGVPLTPGPAVMWQHEVTPKDGAAVGLTAGGHPALILGSYGKGKVAVWTPCPMGEAPAGTTAWWDWAGWPVLAQRVFTWLSEEAAR